MAARDDWISVHQNVSIMGAYTADLHVGGLPCLEI